MTFKVCVAGATGWVGQPLSSAIAAAEDMSLVGAVSRSKKGENLGTITGDPRISLMISGTVAEALESPTDILVDYTKANAVKGNVLAAIERGVHVVIGSSGLTQEDFAEIERAAVDKKVGVIAAGNFSLTAVLLQRFALDAARYLSQWEIMDYFSDAKMDAPSGTARELAFRLSEIREPKMTVAIDETMGVKESRGGTLNGSQVHSVRLPSYFSSVEILFGATDERLSIRHDAGSSATPYIAGTLLAIRNVSERVGLVRGLDRIMG